MQFGERIPFYSNTICEEAVKGVVYSLYLLFCFEQDGRGGGVY